MIEVPGGRLNSAYRLVADVTAHSFRALPRDMRGGPDVQVAARVFARCRARYQAIGLLLAFDQPDDGYALLRGLMGDSQRLQVLARRPTSRMALAFGWQEAAIRDLEERARAAEAVGRTEFAAGIWAITVPQRAALEQVQRELGVKRRNRLPDEGRNLADAAGHADDILDWVIASDPAHGSLPTALWHDRIGIRDAGPGEVTGLRVGGNDPGWRGTVADRATRHMVRAMAAVAVICNLSNADELGAYATDMERRLELGELPEAET
jgi:hypothetical protein